MMTETLGKYQRYQNAAHILNKQAYEQQAKKRKVKQFHPCEKSLVLIRADQSQPASITELECIYTHCTCHPDLTMDDLLEMEFTNWKS